MVRHSSIAVIGAPLDLGAGRRGVDMGPSALRVANLNQRLRELGYRVRDLGNVQVDQPESLPAGPARAKFLPQIAAVCRELAETVCAAADSGAHPLVLGGDHSVAIGTISGMAQHVRGSGGDLGVIWMDAHADMNTPKSSPSGNVHGMPLACVTGKGPRQLTHLFDRSPQVNAGNVALVGVRDVDLVERPAVRKSGVHVFTMRDIDERGMRAVMKDALECATRGTTGFHLSFDMDGVDPQFAPGVGTPVKGGFTYREAHLAMEMVCDSGRMLSMEVVEVNPVIDQVNRTAELAVELVMSAMGKRIL